MAKKKTIPQYTSVERKGIQYYRTRILDADGKQVSLYATTCEELYEKQLAARRQVQEILFHRQHPTVAEYCEKWLMTSGWRWCHCPRSPRACITK